MRQIECGDVQPCAADRLGAMHGTQIAGMALHQGRRYQPGAQQFLRPIDVGHHPLEQAHALQYAGFNLAPALGRDDEGKQVQ